jgi:hypothetical protein
LKKLEKASRSLKKKTRKPTKSASSQTPTSSSESTIIETEDTFISSSMPSTQPSNPSELKTYPGADSRQPSDKLKPVDDNQNNIYPLEPPGMEPTSVNQSNLYINSMTNPSIESISLNHTSPTESSVKLSTNTSATTSLELIRSEPDSCELSSQVPAGSTQRTSTKQPLDPPTTEPLEDLIKDMIKKTQELSSKMDESNFKCLEIRNTLRK